MQGTFEKNLHLAIILGEYIRELRERKGYFSRNRFANEYDLNDSNLGKIENGLIEVKFVTLLKVIQALDISLEEFMAGLIKRLGKDFTLIDQ